MVKSAYLQCYQIKKGYPKQIRTKNIHNSGTTQKIQNINLNFIINIQNNIELNSVGQDSDFQLSANNDNS